MSDGAARVSISTQMSKLWINEAHAYAPISIRIITWICSVTEPRSVFQLIVQHTFTVLIHSHDSHGETAIFFFLSKNLLKPTQHQTEDRRSERPPGEHGGAFSSRREISLRSCERPKKIQQTESEFGLTSLKLPLLGEFSCWHSVYFIHALSKRDKAAHAATTSY